ncbi:hypothetical protein HID58_081474 [Brassica napus]|uniref:Uncharacterized protein n=2 Tax=Brassica napus TaxID=3708 RepID=A0ABQ7Y7T4_BRANA|nr:hypothetical protein HID58_081474 [Brassica napus]
MASRIFLHLHGPQQCLPRVPQVSSLTHLSPGVYVVRTIDLLLKGRRIEGERSWFLQKKSVLISVISYTLAHFMIVKVPWYLLPLACHGIYNLDISSKILQHLFFPSKLVQRVIKANWGRKEHLPQFGGVLDTDGDIIFHGSYYAIPLPADIKRGGLDLLPDLDHQWPKKPRHSSLRRGKRHADDRRDTCIDAELMGTRALKVITLIAGKRSSPELRPPEDEAVNTTRGLEYEATLSKGRRKQFDLLIESQSPQIQPGSGGQKMDTNDTTCGVPIYWLISADDMDDGTSYVTGGPKPESGEDLSKSFFKIKKAGENLSSS